MSVERGRHLRVAYGVGIVCISVLLFWLLPVLIWRNSWGFSGWYSRLPGISSDGGFASGVVATLYLLCGIALVGGVAFVAGGGPTETGTPGDGVPEESPAGAENATDSPTRESTDTESEQGESANGDDADGERGGGQQQEATAPEVLVRLDGVPESAVVGETLEITATVENVGDAGGAQRITLGNRTEAVDLSPGDTGTVRFEWAPAESGARDLTVASRNDTATATVEVTEPIPDFEVDVVGTNAPVNDREPLEVTAKITNNGTAGATQQITLARGGAHDDSTTVTLASGASTNTTLTWDPATPRGEHELRVASANDSDRTTVTVAPVNESAVAGQVFVMSEDTLAEAGVVQLYEAGEDELLDAVDLELSNGTFRFDGLEPGTTYRLELPSAIATLDSGLDVDKESFQTVERTVTATEIQQSADLTYGFEIRGTQKYRWEYVQKVDKNVYNEGYGRYSNGRSYVRENIRGLSPDGEISRTAQIIYLENKSFYNVSSRAAKVWYEEDTTLQKPETKPHQIVRSPADELSSLDWEYEERVVHEGSIYHEYSLAGIPDFPQATIWIDPETGYVVGWEAEHFSRFPSPRTTENPGEILFFDHGNPSITVESPRNDD